MISSIVGIRALLDAPDIGCRGVEIQERNVRPSTPFLGVDAEAVAE
jgi:hypothetical protein